MTERPPTPADATYTDTLGRQLDTIDRIWPRTDTAEGVIADLVVYPFLLLALLGVTVGAATILAPGWPGVLFGIAFWAILGGRIIIHEYRVRREALDAEN